MHHIRSGCNIGALQWWIRHFSGKATMNIFHNTELKEFSLGCGSQKAVLQYKILNPGTIELEHTIVPESLQGQGVGKKLAEVALQYVIDEKLRVKVSCDYVQKYLEKNPKSEITKMLIK